MRAKRKEKFEAATPTSANKPRLVKPRSTTEPSSAKSAYVAPAVPSKMMTSAAARPSTSRAEPKTDVLRERLTIYCYNCRGAGHIAADCPKPRRPVKCSICSSDQHTRDRCPESTAERHETASVADRAYRVDTIASAKPRNPFVKTVLINGRPVVG